MAASHVRNDSTEPEGVSTAPSLPAVAADSAPPWELIESGRYRPRRIRGSYRGRELGWTFVVPPGPGASKRE